VKPCPVTGRELKTDNGLTFDRVLGGNSPEILLLHDTCRVLGTPCLEY